MSYCTLEEAFQTNIPDSVLPPTRQQSDEPNERGEKGRLKQRKHKRSHLPPQEPSVIEPDRPAHRPKPMAELLGSQQPQNDSSTSLSSFLIGASDPSEDYFPYPNESNNNNPNFDKSFMLQPNWYEQFQDRTPNTRAETPPLPGSQVDGYSTLYNRIPTEQSKPESKRLIVAKEDLPGNPTSMFGSVEQDKHLRKRIDDIFMKLDNLEMSRSESNHSEIILFVMTGIFVLLLLDLLLKQGCKAISTIATAASVPARGGYNNPFFF